MELALAGRVTASTALADSRAVPTSSCAMVLLQTLQSKANEVDGPAVDRAVALLAGLAQRSNGHADVSAVVTALVVGLCSADHGTSMEQRQQRECLVHLLCRLHRALAPIVVVALRHAIRAGYACERLVASVCCDAAESIDRLLTLVDPLLTTLEEQLSRCSEVAARCQAIATCGAVWERACEVWAEASASELRKLAAEVDLGWESSFRAVRRRTALLQGVLN
eukprot:4901148-Prymnesium_polylepis.1